MTALVSAY